MQIAATSRTDSKKGNCVRTYSDYFKVCNDNVNPSVYICTFVFLLLHFFLFWMCIQGNQKCNKLDKLSVGAK